MSENLKAEAESQGIYRILGGIYLSNIDPFVKQIDLDEKYGIQNIVSVIREDLPSKYRKSPYNLLHIPIDDDPQENILQYLHQTNEFLSDKLFGEQISQNEGKKHVHKGKVLLHCQAGCSRSVAILSAFLMKYYGMSLKVALYAIRRVKDDILPNDGFVQQLEFFDDLGKNDDVEHLNSDPRYVQFVLSNKVNKEENILNILQDEGFHWNTSAEKDENDEEVPENEEYMILSCKRCRKVLADSTAYVSHIPPRLNGDEENKEMFFRRNAYKSRRIINLQQGSLDCTHHFVEPLNWMKEELLKGELEGKFSCPKCDAKVGGYSWKGSRCSCGKWMIPAIHIQKAKVDEKKRKMVLPNKVSNLEKQEETK
ncbi:hypothetical protein B5S33_g1031 [[Candida] boidinii]|nr:hypothetical protein B5S33_g1031 [[Candida] boidinii]